MTGNRGFTSIGVQPATDVARAAGVERIGSAEVLQQLSIALSAFQRFEDAERTHLDPWEEGSLSVTEQALKRAWLAFSQLHADLQAPLRRRPTPGGQERPGEAALSAPTPATP